ncbi:MAG: hypothetical protein Q8Q73_15870 [Stagnimonas sp.]|nr:hypothetical protein [Stagnimonas sp.]
MNLRRPHYLLLVLQLSLALVGCGADTEKLPVSPPPAVPQVQLSALPREVELGLSSVLSWSSTGAEHCTASGDWSGPRSAAGSESVQPAEGLRVYRLRCDGAGGSGEAMVEVLALAPPPPEPVPTVQLSAAASQVEVGGSTPLSWSSTDARTCTASGGWSGSREPSGQQLVQPAQGANHYVLRCDGERGSATASVEVTGVVSPPPEPPAPTVRLNATPPQVEVGAPSLLSWSSTDARSCTASGGWSGSRSAVGNESVQPQEGNNRYRLRCDGDGGSAEAVVEVLGVLTPPPEPPPEAAELEFKRIGDLEAGCCQTTSP